METAHSACMSVLETLARKKMLFLVQIWLLRICCCKNYDCPMGTIPVLSSQQRDVRQISDSA